nr:MAG TPA: hypothetical protein [Caudoviricetes sp.]
MFSWLARKFYPKRFHHPGDKRCNYSVKQRPFVRLLPGQRK